MNEVEDTSRKNIESEVRSSRRQRCGEIKVKGIVTKNKNEGITTFFLVNCNGFGPGSNEKTDQVIREIKCREIEFIMTSSSDTMWETVKKDQCKIN